MLFTHQELGTRLKLFFMDETSPGSIFWLPHGAHIYNRLVEYIRYYYALNGYSEVIGPNIYDKKLWETSGHWDVYRENMFIIEQGRYTEDKEENKEGDSNKKLFSLKPMNCVSGDVVVGTAHNFSVRMVCLEDFKKMSVIGFNDISKNIEYTDQTRFHSNGVKNCVELKFIDGRSIVCTPDHYISTPNGWVMAKDLIIGVSNVHFVPTPPLILPYDNLNWLTELIGDNKHLITLRMNNETEIYKTFAFTRLCGFLAFAGFKINNSYVIYTEHMNTLDIEQLVNDIRILDNMQCDVVSHYSLCIRDKLYEIVNGVMLSGLRSIFCTFNIPDFLFNADTPQDVICQYLSGLLGSVNTTNDCILSTPRDIKIKLCSSIHRMSNMVNAVKKLISLFNIVGIKNCSNSMYADYSCAFVKIHCILEIPYAAIPHLTKYIGVSYNFRRAMRLCAINSFLNIQLTPLLYRNCFQLDSFKDCIDNINARTYFKRRSVINVEYAQPLYMKLVGRKFVGNKLVYDITVNPVIQSFSANGILVHNCPSHCIMFDKMHPSYKDLPIRLAEFGVLHRHEASGALNGLLRVRRFQQDDSHIFCTLDQVENEVLEVLNFVDHTYNLFGMKYKVYVSTRPDKYIGDIDTWNRAEEILKKCVQDSSKSTKLNIKEGDGAFYGPKIDIALVDGKNRESQCGTIQLDFNLPASDRFNLLYRDIDQQMKHPIIIHRAVLGSIERFIGIILENTQGRLPLWLSPRQIGITTVNKEYNEYASTVQKKIKSLFPQVVVDFDKNTTDDLRNQIKMMETLKYNMIITLGEKEQTDNTLTVRIGKQRLTCSIEEFVAQVTIMLDEYKI